jgi:hypothetical protein
LILLADRETKEEMVSLRERERERDRERERENENGGEKERNDGIEFEERDERKPYFNLG